MIKNAPLMTIEPDPGLEVEQSRQRFEQGYATPNRQAHDLELERLRQVPGNLRMQMDQNKWSSLAPYLTNALRQGSRGSYNSRVGGQSGTGPRISAGPVYDQNRIQQETNSIRARNDQQNASDVQQMQGRQAGAGFGARSPLASALETQMGMGNRANTANQVRDFRQNAAQQNAQQVLKGQTAREGQYASRMGEDIERRRVTTAQNQGLYGLLGQLL